MTRYAPLWLQDETYSASVDRRLIGALWPAARCDGCEVTAAGSGMMIEVGPGRVAVPSSNNTGTVLCVSDAVETLTLDPAPAAGQDRVDLVICQSRGADLDGGTDNDFIFDFITGVPYVPPYDPVRDMPATPPGAVALAGVVVPGGLAALPPDYVGDKRPGPLRVGGTSGLWMPQWTAGGGGPGSVVLGSGQLEGHWTVVGNRCFIDLFLLFGPDSSGGSGPWEFTAPFPGGSKGPPETDIFSKSNSGAGALLGTAIIPKGSTRLIPYSQYNKSNGQLVQTQNCNAGGQPGSGIPNVAADYPFKNGSNFLVSGSYIIDVD